MAKYTKLIRGNFNEVLNRLHTAILEGSMSASYEDGSDYFQDGFSCATRIYERYSCFGGNRVSLSLSLAGKDGTYFLTAITSGGSQALFFKVNTLGEEAFLDTIRNVLDQL